MKAQLKKNYIYFLEKYLFKMSVKKLKSDGISVRGFKNLSSIKDHIIDLNVKDHSKINAGIWFDAIKNKYRLNSFLYRYVRTAEIIKKYIDINSSRLIDFGAGSGIFLEYLDLKGVGIDINQGCVDRMKDKGLEAYNLFDLNESFHNTFDHGFAFEVIEHVENQLDVLNSISNYIKDNGYLFVSIPFVKNSRVIKRVDPAKAEKRIENYHIFELDTVDFKNLISHTNFNVESIEHLSPHKPSSIPIFGKIIDKLFRADRPKWTIFVLKKNS
ncbi:MAG: hypothetical protein CMK92_06835 [Pseudomonas sp.]|nr:hypothetical protein [Pseudomonas sp.]